MRNKKRKINRERPPPILETPEAPETTTSQGARSTFPLLPALVISIPPRAGQGRAVNGSGGDPEQGPGLHGTDGSRGSRARPAAPSGPDPAAATGQILADTS